MPDHLHWLLVPGSEPIHAIMRRTKSCSARCINRRTGHTGRLWQNGFHDHAVRKEEDLAAIARYIIANPVRAGLVRSVREYPFWDCVYI
jgi:REP element-mobilizing transposase RayT